MILWTQVSGKYQLYWRIPNMDLLLKEQRILRLLLEMHPKDSVHHEVCIYLLWSMIMCRSLLISKSKYCQNYSNIVLALIMRGQYIPRYCLEYPSLRNYYFFFSAEKIWKNTEDYTELTFHAGFHVSFTLQPRLWGVLQDTHMLKHKVGLKFYKLYKLRIRK